MKLNEMIKNRMVHCVNVADSVQHAAEIMAQHNIGSVPVLDGDRIVGIFTERDLLTRVIAQKKKPEKVKVSEVMTGELYLTTPDCRISDCISLMKKYNVRHMPVVEGDQLVGIVSLRDLLGVEMEDKDYELRVLHEYIHYIPPYHVRQAKK